MIKTFGFQEQLETLPLSNSNEASQNFINWVEPLLTKKQFDNTKKTLDNFINNDGLILEKKLNEYSKQNRGNWLAPLWSKMYLDIRSPIVIDVNYFIKLITNHLKGKLSSTDIAAVIIYNLMDIYKKISSESFEPEQFLSTPICMSQYKQMFKATRIPKQDSDEFVVKTDADHIIVMYKNHMFKMNLADSLGQRYSAKVIANSLENLLDFKLEANDIGVGVITTAPRDEAAVLLDEVVAFDKNSENFEMLKDALFVVCIDENSKTLHEFAMSLIGSNEDNRYFDKSLQLIFNKNGDFGFNIEHTGTDASSWINVINIVNKELNDIEKYTQDNSTQSIQLEQLDWKLTLNLKEQLYKIRSEHRTKLDDISFETISFNEFGSSKIKSLKYSPDAFLHLALQLAQYRTFGKLKSTYEAVSTRAYLNGRTECNRPISMEVLKFIEAFEDNKTDAKILKELMSAACKQHSKRIKDCLSSNGVERYFFALQNMYTLFGEELGLKEMPEFFNDEGYKKLTYSFISTSRIESKYFDLCGFGPVVPDGYGFWYNLLENQIDMNLISRKSANKEHAKPFRNSIVKSLNDLAKLASN